MNEPNHTNNEPEFDKTPIESMKTLKPRTPRLDWDAIRAAQLAENATLPPSSSGRLHIPAAARFAVAWLSGMAAGVAITFFAMQWLVLRDPRARVMQLEQTVIATTDKPTENPSATDQLVAGIGNLFDLNALLDTPNLSVGSYRGPTNRLVYVRSKSLTSESSFMSQIDVANDSRVTTTLSDGNQDIDPAAPAGNRLQMIKDLQHDIQ